MLIFSKTSKLLQRMAEIFGRRLIALTTGALVILLLLITVLPGSSLSLENWFYDLKHLVASRFRKPHASLVVAGIDMQTLETAKNRWPWPREKVAEVIDRLATCRPRAIILDILFQNEDTEAGDAALMRAIRQAGNILLVAVMEEKSTPQGVSLKRFSSHQKVVGAALAEGFVWGILDSDGRLRQFKLSDQRLMASSCAVEVVTRFFPELGDHIKHLPESAPVVFARANGGIPVISVLDILQNKPGISEFIRDRIVVLGVTAQAAHDYHNTPLGIVAGAEILASSFDTLLSGRIGKNLHRNLPLRILSMFAGVLISLQLILVWKVVFLFPLIIAVLLALMLATTEFWLLHLPLAPFLMATFLVAAMLFAGRYLDHLFALQDMRHEAQNAKEVQERLLPRNQLSCRGYSVCGISRSANELCGDYFDYYLIDERYMLVFIGDATGHGISAALAMSVAKSAMLAAVHLKYSSVQIIELINRVLFQAMQQKVLMTAALMWLDTETGEFSYHNCGHPYPYLLSADGKISQISSAGTFLGRKPDLKVKAPFASVLKPGERLVFYTDGIVESFPGSTDKDGFELFKTYLSERPKENLHEFCNEIVVSHPFFASGLPQPDDFTVVTIERGV